jgi:hypothetical protein
MSSGGIMRTDLKCLTIVRLFSLLVMFVCVGLNIMLMGNLSQARMTSVKVVMISIQQTLEDFKTKTGKYPEKITDIFCTLDADTITRIETLDISYSVNMTYDKYTLSAGKGKLIEDENVRKDKQRFWIHAVFLGAFINVMLISFRNFKRESNAQKWFGRKLFSDYVVLSALFLLTLLLAVDFFNLIS